MKKVCYHVSTTGFCLNELVKVFSREDARKLKRRLEEKDPANKYKIYKVTNTTEVIR